MALIPNATSSAQPYCRSSASDPDGDGWGWENAASCVVYQSSADPGTGDFSFCVIGETQTPLCETDNGSWAYESGAICLAASLCPGVTERVQSPASNALVNSNATTETQAVFSYLLETWGEAMLSGQMDLTWKDDIDMIQRVINDTGHAPALMGYDFMNYGVTVPGVDGLQQTEEAIAWWQRGGLVTFAWHWRDPTASGIGEFYTKSTDFHIPIREGALDTSHSSYEALVADVDLIAAELRVLQNAGVPVLWRPLHEASGGWFWWGRNRSDEVPAAYAQVVLWRFLYERLTDHHGLNNLIWVWNGQHAAWYPGEDYVDIVSFDIYDGTHNYESQIDTYRETALMPSRIKPVALSENSNIPDPDLMQQDGAWWLFFMVWNDTDTAEGVTQEGNFWTGEYYNSSAHKQHVYGHERVITLEELPAFD